MEQEENKQSHKRKHPVLKGVLLGFLGLWVLLLAGVQIALNSKVLGKILDKVAAEYVDGDVTFSRVHASVLRNFPNLNVSLDDFAITYPTDRFAAWDSLVQVMDASPALGGPLYGAGRGGQEDTLLRFDHLDVSLNLLAAAKGKIHVRKATLRHPRIFAHQFDSLSANWNLFRFASAEEDTSALVLPPISVGMVSLSDNPYLVYTHLTDTLSTSLSVEKATLKGRLGNEEAARDKPVLLDISSTLSATTPGTGRMTLPVGLSAEIQPQLDSNALIFEKLAVRVTTVEAEGKGKVALLRDGVLIQADASVADSDLGELCSYFADNFPALKKLRTDAHLSLDLHVDGIYDTQNGRLPDFSAKLRIPQSKLRYQGIVDDGILVLDATAACQDGLLDADVPVARLRFGGIDLSLKGSATDLLQEDPQLRADGTVHARIDSLVKFLPDSLGITASGNLDGALKANLRLSQLQSLSFKGDELDGTLKSDGIRIRDVRDTLTAFLGRTNIVIGPRSGKEAGISATVDSLSAVYGLSTFIHGNGLRLTAYPDEQKGELLSRPIAGTLNAAAVSMRDADSLQIGVTDSRNSFRYRKASGKETMRINLTSANKGIDVRQGANRYHLKQATLSAAASPVAAKEAAAAPKADTVRRWKGKLPDFLSDKDLRKKDIDISLSESLATYIRDWNLSGSIQAQSGEIETPSFPLENSLSGLKAKFTNDRLDVTGATLRAGRSDVSATGSLSGLKRALTGRHGLLNLEASLHSDRIDADELLRALAGSGSSSDKEEETSAPADSVPVISAIIIPANLNAKVSVQANTLTYSDLETSWLSSDIEMRRRCLQLTNTMAMTNMGEAFLEGFYSTKTKDDLKAGFSLTLSNITAEKVIRLFPAVDSILPMIKAFQGLLDCEMTATTSLDRDMHLKSETLNGIIKIDGKNLSLKESESLDKLRKTLKFNDVKNSDIADMSVRGIIRDDKLEIFPFLLDIDRYTVAASGIQNLSQRFKYHISSIRSPMLFRFGVNLKGTFSDWKWTLAKAKYRSTKLPSFDDQVDELRFTLFGAIHNIFEQGADQAIRGTEASQEAIENRKTELDYTPDPQTEELSESEIKTLETLEKAAAEGEAKVAEESAQSPN